MPQTIEVDGDTYRVETNDLTGEPYLEKVNELSGLLDEWVEEHPAVVDSRHDETVEVGDHFGVYVDLVDGAPGTTNIGTARTSAEKTLEEEGYELNVRCYEETGGFSSADGDIVLSVEVEER